MDRLCDRKAWQIKELEVVMMTAGSACVRRTSLGVLSAGRIPIMVIGRIGYGGGPVGCSDWLRVCDTIIIWPGGVGLAI